MQDLGQDNRHNSPKFDVNDLKFDVNGLIPCIAQDANTLEVLMMAWMNREAVTKTLQTGKVTYWSRSRSALWIKGETSGNTQVLVSLRYDCDADTLLALINQTGPACHTNRRSCFYNEIKKNGVIELMTPFSS